MVFSSTAADYVEVLLFANRPGAGGQLTIHSGLLRDVFDAEGLTRILNRAGLKVSGDGVLADGDRMAALLIKAGIAADGYVRGQRTTMHTSHLDADKHVRATVSGMAGAVVGSGRIFVSANTVHQAPDGGGLCAVIVSDTPIPGRDGWDA
jgi:cyanuric acid amidohydrolase